MPENRQSDAQEFQNDYRHIKRDVRKVLLTNLVIIVILVGLFFLNQKTGIIDKLTSHL